MWDYRCLLFINWHRFFVFKIKTTKNWSTEKALRLRDLRRTEQHHYLFDWNVHEQSKSKNCRITKITKINVNISATYLNNLYDISFNRSPHEIIFSIFWKGYQYRHFSCNRNEGQNIAHFWMRSLSIIRLCLLVSTGIEYILVIKHNIQINVKSSLPKYLRVYQLQITAYTNSK